jgi:hypothetical protein
LKNQAEFIFCEAPHIIPKLAQTPDAQAHVQDQVEEKNMSEMNIQEEKGWWFSESNKTYNALDLTSDDTGFRETLDYINKVFEANQSIDGVFSFSQGACLTSILSRISFENDEKYKFIRFKFAILVAGFKSGQTQHDLFYNLEKKVDLPTLHLIGTGDKVIPSEMALKLTEYFVNPRVHVHEAGHFIPVNADSKAVYVDFLNEMKNKIFDL